MGITALLASLILGAKIAAGVAAGGAVAGAATSGIHRSAQQNRTNSYLRQLQNMGLSRADAEGILENYRQDTWNIFNPSSWGNPNDEYDWGALNRDYQDYLSWKDKLGDLPDLPDYEALTQEASNRIDAENAQLNDLYNNMFEKSNNLLQENLNENIASFSDLRNQTLTNEAMAQQGIAGATRFELDRQQRNAISRGASAAQRLVSNINTQLGLQAQSAQQSLNTSNALAQQLLAQRQAQAGIRQDYLNNQNQYQQNQANLIAGTAERKTNYQNSLYGQAENKYNNAMDRWNDRLNTLAGDNPWASYARRQAGQARNGL